MWESRKGTLEYDDFIKEHECPINLSDQHLLFLKLTRSLSKIWNYVLYHISVTVNSKAYPTVVKEQPYGPNNV